MATLRQFDEFARSLPGVTERLSATGRPSYLVNKKMFCAHREERPDAIDEHGRRLSDVLVIRTPDEPTKFALIHERGDVWFTTAHFNGYAAVLTRASFLRQLPVAELKEVITEAWRATAPVTLRRQFDAG